MTCRQTVTVSVLLILCVIGFMGFGLWASTSHANGPVSMPPGVTMLFDGQNVGIRVFVQCDDVRHNLVYASASALVVIKSGC